MTDLLDSISVFKPLPWQRAALLDTSRVVLLAGSSGGGKSITGLEKLVAYCLHYPGSNCLALRKQLDDCNRSILPTLDEFVLKGLLTTKSNVGIVTKSVSTRCYIFDNGSRIWWSGVRTAEELDALRSIGSGGSIEFIFMEEGTQFEERDFDELRTRLRGTAAPWNQILIATNPDAPSHWIYRRLIVGEEASVHLSRAADNPHVPQEYVEDLSSMKGVRGDRMARGMWVEGSGLVIDTWQNTFSSSTGADNGGNVSLSAEYVPRGGRIVWAVDDGYTGEYDAKAKMFTANSHPRVFLLAQIRPTGQVCVFYESYAVKVRYGPHIKEVLDVCTQNGWPRPAEVHYDKSSATLRSELDAQNLRPLYPSTSNRDESIKLLAERIAADDNGFRPIIVHPRCHNLILEMSSWGYIDGRPSKQFDHGADALRYMTFNLNRGYSQDGAVGINITDSPAGRHLQEKMDRIDEIMGRFDHIIGV